MKKSVISKLALLLVIAMLMTLVAGCGDKPASTPAEKPAETPAETPADAPADTPEDKQFVVATNTWGSGVPIVDMIGDSRQYVLELFGIEVLRASDDFTSDKELQNGQNFIAAGVDGICFQGGGPTVIPRVAELCEENQIPMTVDTQVGTPEIREPLYELEYFLGAIETDCVLAGAQLAQRAWDDGCRTATIIGGNIGDTNMDDRSKGFREKFEELGGTVVGEARCTDASECATKCEDMLSANRDADCIYAMVGDYVAGTVSAIQNLGLEDIKFYLSNIDGDSAQYIKDGIITAGNDGTLLPPMLATVLMINYLDGCKIETPEGKAPYFKTVPIEIDPSNVDLYIEIFCTTGVQPIDDNTLESMLYRCNPDVDYDHINNIILNNLSLEKLAEGHGK